MKFLADRKYWPWYYLLAVFATLWIIYKIFFQLDTTNKGQIVRDYLNNLSLVQRANTLGQLQSGSTLQIPKALGTYSLEVKPSAYLQQMASNDIPSYPNVFNFPGSDRRVIFINDSVFYFFNGVTFQVKKLGEYRLRTPMRSPFGSLLNFEYLFQKARYSPVFNIEGREFVIINASHKSRDAFWVRIDKTGGWIPINASGLPFSLGAVKADSIAGFRDSSFYRTDFYSKRPLLKGQLPPSVKQPTKMRLSKMLQFDSVYLVFSSDTIIWLGQTNKFDKNDWRQCKLDNAIRTANLDLTNAKAKRIGQYILFFNQWGGIYKLDLKTSKIAEELDPVIRGFSMSAPDLHTVGEGIVAKYNSHALLIKATPAGLKYTRLMIDRNDADEVNTATHSFTENAIYRLDWTLDNEYKLWTALPDTARTPTWTQYSLTFDGDTVDINGFNYINMQSGSQFACVATVNPKLPFFAFHQQANGRMGAVQLGSLVIPDEMIESLTVIPNPYIIIVFSAFLMTLISLGFVVVKDISIATEEKSNANDFKLSNLRDRIAELNGIARHLKVRYNVMLFLGIIFGVGGVVSFYIVLRYTIHIDASGVFANEENIVNLIRAAILLTFIETFTFFFLRQYRVIFNEYKLFLSMKFRLSNFFHALEVSQSDAIADTELKKEMVKRIMDENYRLSADDPRLLTEDLVRANQVLLENVLNKALNEFKGKG